MGFKLEANRFELEIALEPLDEIHIHEEIIPQLLERLVRDIKLSGKVRDPVIVDSNTKVVLDGMHRVAALREIGCRYVPTCLVDYRDPKVMVACWYRVIKGKAWTPRFMDVLKLPGLEVDNSSVDDALKALDEREATAALLTAANCHLFKAAKKDIRESYVWVKRLERAVIEKGFNVWYETESDAKSHVKSKKASATLLVPRVRKEEVMEAGLLGNLFAHKTTRHVLPVRPMNVGVPLEWLRGKASLDEVNRKLVEHLSKRKLEQLPKGSLFAGRRHEEELLVFR